MKDSKMNLKISIILFFLLFHGTTILFSDEAKGVVIKNVACVKSPGTHYNLFLPSNYDAKKEWPLMFIFSPSGNANPSMYQEQAEKLGWILIGSVECKNGPMDPIIKHQTALMEEVEKKYSVHPRRMYATGFSGGSRMSFRLMYTYSNKFDGLIPVGAGEMSGGRKKMPWATIYGFAGNTDMNLNEMKSLQKSINGKSVKKFILEEFQGGHTWAPNPLLAKAMIWLEKEFYLKRSRLTKQDKKNRLPAFLKNIENDIVKKGTSFEAFELCQDIVKSFKSNPNAKNINSIYNTLKKDVVIKKEIMAKKKYLAYISQFGKIRNPKKKQLVSYYQIFKKIGKAYPTQKYGLMSSSKAEAILADSKKSKK
ncbi:MAG: hypothetical protein COA79_09290 [Planctomycetota bacterium]|nr:MAG: hypothetical protein COA79_09290 [Planctomycetota bacterium]